MIRDIRYSDGYGDAILDILHWFEYHRDSLKALKLNTHKGTVAVLKKLFDRRNDLFVEKENLELMFIKEELKLKAGGKD